MPSGCLVAASGDGPLTGEKIKQISRLSRPDIRYRAAPATFLRSIGPCPLALSSIYNTRVLRTVNCPASSSAGLYSWFSFSLQSSIPAMALRVAAWRCRPAALRATKRLPALVESPLQQRGFASTATTRASQVFFLFLFYTLYLTTVFSLDYVNCVLIESRKMHPFPTPTPHRTRKRRPSSTSERPTWCRHMCARRR